MLVDGSRNSRETDSARLRINFDSCEILMIVRFALGTYLPTRRTKKESAAPTMHANAYTVYAATTNVNKLDDLGHILQTCYTHTKHIRYVASS